MEKTLQVDTPEVTRIKQPEQPQSEVSEQQQPAAKEKRQPLSEVTKQPGSEATENKQPEQPGSEAAEKKQPEQPEPVDAAIDIHLREANVSAVINITAPKYGGEHITYEKLCSAIEEAGIVFGLMEPTIKKTAEAKTYGRDVTIAVYKPPIAGKDGFITYKFDKYVSAIPTESEDGSVDYRELGQFRSILSGTLIAEITEPVEGKSGTDVLGHEIAPSPVKKAAFTVGVGTVLSLNGKTITAAIDGLLVWEKTCFAIRRVLDVKQDIDFNTGNIEFLGDINVKGNVGEGFKVVSTGGNITILGGVFSGAEIRAKGNVILKQVANHATIIAGGGINATFCEYCEVRAEGDITAQTMMISNVYCGGNLNSRGTTGGLIGGRYTALCGIAVNNNVGSPHYPSTEIFLGNNTILTDERDRLIRTIENRKNEITDLTMIIDYLNEKKKQEFNLTEEKEELLGESVRKRIMRRGDISAANKRIEEIGIMLENRQDLRMEVRGTIFTKTKINIDTEHFELKNDWTKVSVYLDDEGEFHFSPL
jgi:uncharacterized protein (DUF342 family)